MPVDSTLAESKKNSVSVTADKVANVFTFNGKADLLYSGKYGEFTLKQNYRGNILKTYITVSVDKLNYTVPFTALRDDEELVVSYSYPVTEYLSLMINQNNIISTDNISSGTNDLQRIGSQIGLILKSGKNMFLNLSGGMEDNKTLGIQSWAKAFTLKGYAREMDIFDVLSNSSLSGDMLQFDDGREYADFDLQADVLKKYEDNGVIEFNLKYKKQNRDLIVARYISGSDYPVESRLEDKIGADFRLGFQLLDPLYSNFTISINNLSVNRHYSHEIEGLDLSYVGKNLNEFRLSFSGSLDFIVDRFKESVSISYESRDERNRIKNIYGLDKSREASLRNLENQRDNISSVTRFSSKTLWQLSATDTLNVDYNMSLSRYDTPSDDNNDERDNFNGFFRASWVKYYSESFTSAFIAELQMSHRVYLKSTLSAGNYWNRVLRLAPEFRYKTKYFTINPVFEILANYTAYDYEDVSESIRSYSKRQLAYRDTIYVPLSKGFSLQSGIDLRYYENGQLLWKSFAEAPQRSNFEQFYKLMIIKNFTVRNFIGFGLRYYNYNSKNIGNSQLSAIYGSDPVESYGLESIINYFLFNNSNISLQGWYEFQKVNNKQFKTFPNFYILTTIYL